MHLVNSSHQCVDGSIQPQASELIVAYRHMKGLQYKTGGQGGMAHALSLVPHSPPSSLRQIMYSKGNRIKIVVHGV